MQRIHHSLHRHDIDLVVKPAMDDNTVLRFSNGGGFLFAAATFAILGFIAIVIAISLGGDPGGLAVSSAFFGLAALSGIVGLAVWIAGHIEQRQIEIECHMAPQ